MSNRSLCAASSLVLLMCAFGCEERSPSRPPAAIASAPAIDFTSTTPAVDDAPPGSGRAVSFPSRAHTKTTPAPNTPTPPVGVGVRIDSDRSSIAWRGAKVTGDHTGKIEAFVGSFSFDTHQDVAQVQLSARMDSISSDEAQLFGDKLVGHLKSEDFFQVEKFPTANFISTEVYRVEARAPATHMVEGIMMIRDVKQRITFPATIVIDHTAREVRTTASMSINRKDFGILYGGKADDLIRDEFDLEVELIASWGGE